MCQSVRNCFDMGYQIRPPLPLFGKGGGLGRILGRMYFKITDSFVILMTCELSRPQSHPQCGALPPHPKGGADHHDTIFLQE
jgi:hypothetical protein